MALWCGSTMPETVYTGAGLPESPSQQLSSMPALAKGAAASSCLLHRLCCSLEAAGVPSARWFDGSATAVPSGSSEVHRCFPVVLNLAPKRSRESPGRTQRLPCKPHSFASGVQGICTRLSHCWLGLICHLYWKSVKITGVVSANARFSLLYSVCRFSSVQEDGTVFLACDTVIVPGEG